MFLLAFLLDVLMMIVFSCLKKEFFNYIKSNTISNKVYDAYKETFNKKTKLSQIKSWANSLPFLCYLIEALPDDTGITIEYAIPLTSKRIDVVISGFNIFHKPVIALLELKQWESAQKVQDQIAIVRTRIGKTTKNTLHPAYQVLGYKELLKNYNINIEKLKIEILPFVYLHNYDLKINDDILDKKYKSYYEKALMFGKNNKEELKYILENNICFGDNLKIIKMIDGSEVKPTKKLANVIYNMTCGKKEFHLLDEQKEIAEKINMIVKDTYENNTKKVIIIKGGPGTGKSVLAINALGSLLNKGLIGAYVSKNMAPRNVYKSIIMNTNVEFSINELFKGSGSFYLDISNKYDFLLIDEAHRLQEKSGMHYDKGENQIKEIINATRTSIFFIDEKQIITLRDIGTIDNIKRYAKEAQAEIIELELFSQFRCNGSDNYLEFVDNLLYKNKITNKFSFDFKVIDSPLELRNLIKLKNTNNNARLVAGFCWKRLGQEADNQDYYDIKIGEFEASWNLKHGEPFAIRESAINEVGCVHNVQGLEFDYIGVIIGPDLRYENGKIITDYKKRANTEKSLYGLYVLMKKDKNHYEKAADSIIRNTYRVLLTRGIKGCYVYACDEALQQYLKKLEITLTISQKKN